MQKQFYPLSATFLAPIFWTLHQHKFLSSCQGRSDAKFNADAQLRNSKTFCGRYLVAFTRFSSSGSRFYPCCLSIFGNYSIFLKNLIQSKRRIYQLSDIFYSTLQYLSPEFTGPVLKIKCLLFICSFVFLLGLDPEQTIP